MSKRHTDFLKIYYNAKQMDETSSNKPTGNNRFTKIYLTLWGICLVAIVLALIFYNTGFRLTNHLVPTKIGSIELSSNESDIQIFLDNRPIQISATDHRYTIGDIPPGLHSVMVYKNGFWPWIKSVDISPNTASPVFAFIFPTEGVATATLQPGTNQYNDAAKKIAANILPVAHGNPPSDQSFSKWLARNIPNLKISADKNTALFTEDNAIEIMWISDNMPPPHYLCEKNPCLYQMPITTITKPIKNVDFYKGRGDVVLFSSGTAIYAIDVDRSGTQNFQPLYHGKDPYFYENTDGTLFIKDGAVIARANL